MAIKKQKRLTLKEINTLFSKIVKGIIQASPYTGEYISVSIQHSSTGKLFFSIHVAIDVNKYPNDKDIIVNEKANSWALYLHYSSFDKGIQEIIGKLVLAVTDTSDLDGAIVTEELEDTTVNLLFP